MGYESYSSAGVICQGNTSALTECKHGDVRLIGGHKKTEGRVELCSYGHWAIACSSNWDSTATQLLCKQLGLPKGC